MDDGLEERIEALERTVADGEFDRQLSEEDEIEDRLSALESRLETTGSRIDDLEAATQALRGYVGNIRAVNDDVEQRANAALSKAEALESSLDSAERAGIGGTTAPGAEQAEPERCQACGRTHDRAESAHKSGPTRPPGATDGGLSHTSGSDRRPTTDDPLVPDDSDETGALQRIRELL
jgi:DNA repair exonuclease SbcCD ATPase subunit